MLEAGQIKKFCFPGYGGALPKATRSSRGRAEFHKKYNQPHKDLNCIELLATVAGQVVHEEIMQAGNVTHKSSADEMGVVDVIEGSFQADVSSVQYQQFDILEKDAGPVVSSEAHNVSGLDNALPNSVVTVQNVASAVSENPSKANAESYEEGICTFEDNKLLKIDGSNYTKATCAVPQPGYLDHRMHSEIHDESDTNCSSFRDGNAREGMTLLPEESPLPISAGSSKEAPMHVHTDPSGLFSDLPLERHIDVSQDLARFRAKDDDDNFSDMVVPMATSPSRPLRPALTTALQIKEARHGSFQRKTSVAGAKRTCSQTDVDNTEKTVMNCKNECTAHQLVDIKRQHVLGPSMPCTGLDKSSGPKSFDLDAKDASVGSSSTTNSKSSWRSAKRKLKETHEASPVKVNITSFRVPELSINLPETATVANLKRAVMEAAVNLLGGGLHVRVLHHGKKVYDESSTLVQMGVSCEERLESLAFMLEPNQISNTSIRIEESVFACRKMNQPATWYPVFNMGDDMDGNRRNTMNVGTPCVHSETSEQSALQGKSETMTGGGGRSPMLHQCSPGKSLQPTTAAIILHPDLEDSDPVQLVAGQHNFEGIGGKRRTRRPFTVTEVEALVKAVELLGTGRWREVKQQVFSQARHRTYVDLKDKWKTLVHTARIAPHQRRGEPVPQELLDRVLQVHTYWAVQLAKQQEALGI